MKTIFVAFIGSICVLISGCVTTNDLEKKMETIEMKIDSISSLFAGGRPTLDVNNDAKITRTEYDSRLREIFSYERKILDSNGDGKISEKELTVVGKSTNLFSAFDKDNDGLITESEFIRLFDGRFNTADRNSDGEISMEDTGLLDNNNDENIDINEYREGVNNFFAELTSDKVVKGYGYSQCSTQYILCDAGCTRCIALFIPGSLSGSWGGSWGGGSDPCEGVNIGDPWGPDYDPLHPCQN